jgi:hypothetical protein
MGAIEFSNSDEVSSLVATTLEKGQGTENGIRT